MDQWADLIGRCRKLIDYLTLRENELIAAHPAGGNLEKITKQQSDHQVQMI